MYVYIQKSDSNEIIKRERLERELGLKNISLPKRCNFGCQNHFNEYRGVNISG